MRNLQVQTDKRGGCSTLEVFLPVKKPKEEFLVLGEDVALEQRDPTELYSSVECLLKRSFVNVDKPRGPSSHEVTAWVGRLLNVERVGHGGTLDVEGKSPRERPFDCDT